MKFAREFKAALQSGDYPEEWCLAAIPYPALKKCLNKIRAELQDLGLDADSLRQLLGTEAVLSQGDHIPLAKYKLDVSDFDVRPRFTIFIDFEDETLVDATLSSASRAFLEKQVEIRRSRLRDRKLGNNSDRTTTTRQNNAANNDLPTSSNGEGTEKTIQAQGDDLIVGSAINHKGDEIEVNKDTCALARTTTSLTASSIRNVAQQQQAPAMTRRVEVSLMADSEFFRVMYEDMAKLERIGQAEQTAIVNDIEVLGKEVAIVARPLPKRHLRLWGSKSSSKSNKNSKFHQRNTAEKNVTDMARWRELFQLYLEAQVFFSTRERDHGRAHTSMEASKQLNWFQKQVRDHRLLDNFQLPASLAAYQHFLLLNKRLYLNLRFRELNQTAQAKILKKFDKWTALGVSKTFPNALAQKHRHDLLVEGMAKDVCARIADDIVAIVPRLEDYMCPVCYSLAWLPVRLRCRHVFCVRCIIKMQREQQKLCPLCRGEVVAEADLDNLDQDLERFLKLYFRQETKEKQKANEVERGIELFGQDYKPTSCALM